MSGYVSDHQKRKCNEDRLVITLCCLRYYPDQHSSRLSQNLPSMLTATSVTTTVSIIVQQLIIPKEIHNIIVKFMVLIQASWSFEKVPSAYSPCWTVMRACNRLGLLTGLGLESELAQMLNAILVKHGKSIISIEDPHNHAGETILHEFGNHHEPISAGALCIVLHAIGKDNLLQFLCPKDSRYKDTALHLAASQGQTIMFQIISDILGIAVEHVVGIQNSSGWTCLHWAMFNNNADFALAVLQAVSNHCIRSIARIRDQNGQNILHYAAFRNQAGVAKAILDAHGDNDESRRALIMSQDNNGSTPLHEAMAYGRNHHDVLRVMLSSSGMSALQLYSIRDKSGRTPFDNVISE
jgi:hypothetical protein